MAEQNERTAQVTWVQGLQFVGHADASGATVVLDGATEHGGSNAGVRPMEALLLSLAGCTAMDVISIMQKKRQKVTALQVRAVGTRAEEHPKRFVKIELQYVARGYNLSEQAFARSIELSQTKYCSVTATLNCEITHTCRIEQEKEMLPEEEA